MAEETRMDRVRTGIEGLDGLLYGGLLRGDAMLVAGAPGTGKTSLGMQFVYNGATRFGEPGVFITFEEFPQRIYRDAMSFGWDFPALQDEGKLRVVLASPDVLQEDIKRDQGIVGGMIEEIGARRVVVDSISHLQEAGNDPVRYREAVYGLVNALKRNDLTTLMTRELREQEEMGTGPEEFVADGVIVLSRAYVGDTNMRFLEVMKSRGSALVPIPSLYTFTDHGIVVVPPFNEPIYQYEEAVSVGNDQLDRLLGGGIPYGGFYVLEMNADINPSVFEVGFAKETLEAGDCLMRVAGTADPRSGWRAFVKAAGLEQPLRTAEGAGRVSFLWSGATANGNGGISSEAFGQALRAACDRGNGGPVRVNVDISRLFALLPPGEGYRQLSAMAALCREKNAVVLGTVSPSAVQENDLDRIRAFADGLVRVWTQGNYSYLQVVKTANSTRTPVLPIKQTSEPPFLQIMEY
jgi:circadian clock protein KaiC